MILTLKMHDDGTWTTWGSASLQNLLFNGLLPTIDWIIQPELLHISVLQQTRPSGHLELKRRQFYVWSPTHPRDLQNTGSCPPYLAGWNCMRDRQQKWVKLRGLWAKLKLSPHRLPLQGIFLTNVWSLAIKMDESITNFRWIMDSIVMFFTETWLNRSFLDNAVELAGCHTHCADRTVDDSAKTRGGRLCI